MPSGLRDKFIPMIIVQKYGGKSVATIDRIRDVAGQIIENHIEGVGLVVVVSAMADTTDELLRYAKLISSNPRERELDMLLTAGERISMALLSMAIWDSGHSAISFTGSQSGIITDDVHTRARIIEIRASRIISELQHGRIVIVAGFQGVSAKREITTLGRGGSDTTAVALACAIGADRCEIFSDVDGLYSADPKRCDDAVHIPEIDYETLFDLTFFGAKVVHPRAVELARKYNIPITLASSIHKEKRTMVKSKAMEGTNFVAISSQEEIFWVSTSADRKEIEEILNHLDKSRTNIRSPYLTDDGNLAHLSFWVLPEQADEVKKILDEGKYDYETQMASLVAVSGYGIAESSEAMTTIIKILNDGKIPFAHIGTTNRTIFVVVDKKYREKVESLFHRKLIVGRS